MTTLFPARHRGFWGSVLLAVLLAAPSVVFCEEWMGGDKAAPVVTKIDAENKRFWVEGQTSIVWAWTDNIRRVGPGTNRQAPLGGLQVGMHVRVFGAYGSSPLGMIAQRIVIVAGK